MYSEYDLPEFNYNNSQMTFKDYIKDPKIVLSVIVPLLVLITFIIMYYNASQAQVKIDYLVELENVKLYKVEHKNRYYLLATSNNMFQIIESK